MEQCWHNYLQGILLLFGWTIIFKFQFSSFLLSTFFRIINFASFLDNFLNLQFEMIIQIHFPIIVGGAAVSHFTPCPWHTQRCLWWWCVQPDVGRSPAENLGEILLNKVAENCKYYSFHWDFFLIVFFFQWGVQLARDAALHNLLNPK